MGRLAERRPLLRAAGLTVGYGPQVVVRDVDLTVSPGEVVALLGPNGSGKSTLLRSLLHLIAPLAGEVWLQDQPSEGMNVAERARRAAYVPQEERPAFGFTVGEVVLMGRTAYADGLFESPEDHAAARAAMMRTDTMALAGRRLDHLSGGERQRVLLARALAQEARLLLLDEPTSHLDPGHGVQLASLIREASGEGYGVLCAVHDLNWAAMTADRVVLLHEGRVALTGAVTEVMTSEALDAAYGVRFVRVAGDDGRPRLFPVTNWVLGSPGGAVHSTET